MESLQNRLNSFAKTKRVKNPEKTSSFVQVKWTHPKDPQFIATPEALANAGFYFNPSFEDRDNVACFMCDKQLAYWEPEDDPYDIHWKKCGDDCCWAIVRCGLRGDMDRHGVFKFPDKSRLPTSKAMERARLRTFAAGDGWIHDQVKNHGASSRKMARAGFVYTPQKPGDDLVTCLYCNVALGGWDEFDDPIEEHRKRRKSCPIFSFVEVAVSKRPSRSASTQKLMTKSQALQLPPSKLSRSTSSSRHNDLVMPMKTHDGDGEGEHEADPHTRPASSSRRSTSAPARTRSTTGKETKTPKHKRSRSRSDLRDAVEDGGDDEGPEDIRVEEQTRVATGKTRRTKARSASTTRGKARSRLKSVARATRQDEQDEEQVSDDKASGYTEVEEESVPAVTGKTSKTKARNGTSATRAKARTRSKSFARADKEDEQNDEQSQEEVVHEMAPMRSRPKGRKVSGRVPTEIRAETMTSKKLALSKIASHSEGSESDAEGTNALKNPFRGRTLARVSGVAEVPIFQAAKKMTKNKASSIVLEHQTADELPGEEKLEPAFGSKVKLTSRMPLHGELEVTSAEEHNGNNASLVERNHPPIVETSPKQVSLSSMKASTSHTKPKASSMNQTKGSLSISEASARRMAVEGMEPVSDDGDEIDAFFSPPTSFEGFSSKLYAQEMEDTQGNGEKAEEMAPLPVLKRSKMKSSLKPAPEHAFDSINAYRPPSHMAKKQQDTKNHTREKSVEPEVRKLRKTSTLKVVEISTDEESDAADGPKLSEDTPNNIPFPSKQRKDSLALESHVADRASISLETQRQNASLSSTETAKHQQHLLLQTQLQDAGLIPGIEPALESQPWVETHQIEEPPVAAFQTPPRQTVTKLPSPLASISQPLALPLPPLSKIPFTPQQNLTEAEMNMTVEEWIRYQMEVEYDKFRRDGEREIGRFKQRAEEVRGIIERL